MKKILALGSLLLSLNGLAQSYMILDNGVTLTIDRPGLVYDFSHFIMPVKVTLSGGQFLAEEGKLVTIDSQGFLYRKDEKVPSRIKGKGNNYIIADNGALMTFDLNGFFYKFDKEASTKKSLIHGGNFFTVKPEDRKPLVELYTLNSLGNYFKLNVAGLNPAEITVAGGTYFQTSKGVTYTITKDGFVFAKPEMKVGAIKKIGGNFFVDSNNALFTVSELGYLMLPILPANLIINSIVKVGQNYMIDSSGRVFVVDNLGVINERTVNHDLRRTKVLSI